MLMKPHLEFHKLDLTRGWETLPGYPPGFQQKILATDFDEAAKSGGRSRLMKIDPGAFTTMPFVHDHWEEVFLFWGDLLVGNDVNGQGGELFLAPTYAIRPPGVYHGPFATRAGCIILELHYYRPREGQRPSQSAPTHP
jgi:hypothetical protein